MPVRFVRSWGVKIATFTSLAALLASPLPASAQTRALGTDISYWNCGTSSTGISQANWNTAYSTGLREYVFMRATRGGTTGQNQASGTPGGGSGLSGTQRYDDSRFVQNLIRARTAGMIVGPYHFARPDVVGNTGTDEADHFIQMAGPWMRPGYMMPMYDQEASSAGGADALVQFAMDFSDRIYAVMQIRPCIYINGSYSGTFASATAARRDAIAKPAAFTPSVVGPDYPMLWDAYYTTNLDIYTANPKDGYSGFYGPWDDYGNTSPWAFWQHWSDVSIPGLNAVDASCDSDISHGDMEFVRNFMVPAVWWNDLSGDWGTMTNWNSGQTPVAPVTPPEQATPYATGGLPTPRSPGASGTGETPSRHDMVILERPNANITVTLSTGAYSIRKLYNRETLVLSGGSLSVNYDPTYRPDNSATVLHGGPISAQFSGPVVLSNSATFVVPTLQVDTNRTFTIAGGTLTFKTINLMPHASLPSKILMTGNASFGSISNVMAVIQKGSGTGNANFDLGGGFRTLTVSDGTNVVDVSIDVPISNGGLGKSGAGTLRLTVGSTYASGTTVSAGRLLVNNTSGSGTGSGAVTVSGGTLGGTGILAGPLTVNAGGTLSPGASIGTMTISGAGTSTLGGTTFIEIDRNGGAPQADKLALNVGSLSYGGTLTVTNIGAAVQAGDVFTLFSAQSYSGDFSTYILPPLGAGTNWYTGMLATNGTLRVNRKPSTTPLTFTNTLPAVLQIPFATLAGNGTDPDGDSLAVSAVSLTSTNGVVLSTNATSISYSNNLGANDQFTYTLTDNHGGSVTGIVNVVNIAQPAAAQFVGAPQANGNSTTLHFSATPGWTYYLERSTNVPDWKTIWTNVAPPGGTFDYVDDFHDLPAPPASALYRMRW